MRKGIVLMLLAVCNHLLIAQSPQLIAGRVTDTITGERLAGASISIFSRGKISGTVSNREGQFTLPVATGIDSVKLSMVGYRSKTLDLAGISANSFLSIALIAAPAILEEVTVTNLTAQAIIKRAADRIASFLPETIFDSKGFYREVIKDHDHYFSVAEAVFRAQFNPAKEKYVLQLLQGRSREDVAYTRLFEDYHPGGGPQAAIGNSFILNRPDFLNSKKTDLFIYTMDSLVQYDGTWLYSISFDQRPGVHEALEKGKALVRTGDYAVVSYEAGNSTLGAPYIKSLSGTDKLMAALLHIDINKKAWKRRVDFTAEGNKWVMRYASAAWQLEYRQPKKNLDLDLSIETELLMSEPFLPAGKEISKDQEWKRKDMAVNLPGVFDSAYWGDNAVIAATVSVNDIIAHMPGNGKDSSAAGIIDGWNYMNRHFFVAMQRGDTSVLIPIAKSYWEDDKAGGMLYRNNTGNFIIEARIDIAKRADPSTTPERGFQQAGIIIRSDKDSSENYILVSIGTGGNPVPKLFFKKTIAGKSNTVVNKISKMSGWLKIERQGNQLIAYFREDNSGDWKKAGACTTTLPSTVQYGLAVSAHFAGDAPKMQPDMQARFTHVSVVQQ